MEPVKGVVVRATAGRDQGMFFVVLERNGTTVLLANGKDRPLHAPKRKHVKHIQLTNRVIALDHLTDKALRNVLKEYV